MSNMSYCRFQNTWNDLKDVYHNLQDDGLSEDESFARRKLIELCEDIAREGRELLDEEDAAEERMNLEEECPGEKQKPGTEDSRAFNHVVDGDHEGFIGCQICGGSGKEKVFFGTGAHTITCRSCDGK